MIHLYRHKQNGKLYTITHIVLDIYHLNRNGFSGIEAKPYKWQGDIVTHRLEDYRSGKILAHKK